MDSPARRLSIYIGESDRWEGRPLYEAIVQKTRELGLAGATVFKGVQGFGAHSKVRSLRLLELSQDLPIKIEIIDHPDQIERLLPFVETTVQEGLVVLEEVEMFLYRHGRKEGGAGC
ncbi:MAG: DUF190 domain-containing protein [Bacillota bacterium]|nr:DUF190 domain-containing protein [Bacillota bacterium]